MTAKKSMLIDVSKCIGCRSCQVACKQWNQLPGEKTAFTGSYQNPPKLSGITWTLIQFIEPEEGETRWLFRKQQCLHCTDASCVTACPTGAAQKREDGIVWIDQDMCTGCKYCVESCPFGTPQFNRTSGTAIKCRLCMDRVTNGLTTACSKACPTDAINYGTREEMLVLAKKRKAAYIKAHPGSNPRIYGETELGGLNVMYLLPEPASTYGLPENPRVPVGLKTLVKWFAGILPVAGILFGVMRFFRDDAPSQPSQGADVNAGGV
ncbi:4Fe-4S dicluster domain-containing protein [Spirochaetota bacterium]